MLDAKRTFVGGRLTKIQDELENLHDGNVLLPPNPDSTRTLEVVPVHNHVHSQVQGNGNPRNRGVANQLCVAKEGGRAVVVGVEEG